MTKCTDFCQYCTNFCLFANYGAIVPGELTCACCKIVACTPWRNRPYLFRAPQIARAWHALHPKSIHAPCGSKQLAAALPRTPNRTCMACIAPQCALRLKAACYGSSAHPKSHVHGMPCTPMCPAAQRIPWQATRDTRKHFVCPLWLFAFSIFNFQFSIHTGLSMAIAIRAVWTDGI